MDQRGFPTSLPEFQAVFPNDAACAKYLEKMRWPDGFTCPKCGVKDGPLRPKRTAVVFFCRACKSNISLNGGTVMRGTRTPLSTWFWAAYLVTTQTPGQSALQFQRQLGLSRYETAFQILHKLRAAMVRPERDTIGGEYPVEIDEAYIGNRSHDMATVGVAVEVRVRKDKEDRAAKRAEKHEGGKPLKRLIYAGRLRIRICEERTRTELCKFVQENVASGSIVRTDACNGYDPLSSLGYIHQRMAVKGDEKKIQAHLPLVHLIISNLKTWLLGTHHGAIAKRHLQSYLNEFCYRFNRRFYPMTSFHSVLGLAAHAKAPTYDSLYQGDWVHPV